MAGGQERILRRRIKSVESTKKITRAMELIAATRVVKAQERAASARPYSDEITSVIIDLLRAGAAKEHPLLRDNPDARTAAFVVITSDRGMCGAYNSNVIRAAERAMTAAKANGLGFSLIVVGKKAQKQFKFQGFELDAAFEGMTDQPIYDNARDVAATVRRRYETGELAYVDIAYTQFLSAGVQQAVVQRFLPLEVPEVDPNAGPSADLEYEPSPTGILNEILPRYLESRLFSALLDASASEHASRQRAMKAATDNAEDLKVLLSRTMNRARQDAITTEIMEIVGGAEALSADKGSKDELLPSHLNAEHLFPDHLDRTDHTQSIH
ncbi:MAG: F0F1 ATP synthase subunit gamma [Actinobacteria bacterium]|nr:F0F1 ATP synthase subunit gamma [Actinomycetota bacterium]